jgi:hypothetical protein
MMQIAWIQKNAGCSLAVALRYGRPGPLILNGLLCSAGDVISASIPVRKKFWSGIVQDIPGWISARESVRSAVSAVIPAWLQPTRKDGRARFIAVSGPGPLLPASGRNVSQLVEFFAGAVATCARQGLFALLPGSMVLPCLRSVKNFVPDAEPVFLSVRYRLLMLSKKNFIFLSGKI